MESVDNQSEPRTKIHSNGPCECWVGGLLIYIYNSENEDVFNALEKKKIHNMQLKRTLVSVARSTSRRRFLSMSSQASRLEGLDRPTVWTEFSPLSAAHNAVTLGQGFPNWPPPKFAIDAFHEALDAGEGNTNNQYTRPECHPRLAKTLAEDYSNKLNREIDWASEVASGVGCTQVLYLTMQGLINPGDEVVLFEVSEPSWKKAYRNEVRELATVGLPLLTSTFARRSQLSTFTPSRSNWLEGSQFSALCSRRMATTRTIASWLTGTSSRRLSRKNLRL